MSRSNDDRARRGFTPGVVILDETQAFTAVQQAAPAVPLRPVEPVSTVLRQADHWARAIAPPGTAAYLDRLAAEIRTRVVEPMIAAQPVELAQLTDDNARLADELARVQHALQHQTRVAEALAEQLAEAKQKIGYQQ